MVPLSMVFRRMLRRGDTVLTVALGVLLATALLASAPLLVDTVVTLGLRHTLQTADPLASNLRLLTHTDLDAAAVAAADALVREETGKRLGPALEGILLSVESPALFPWIDGELATDQRVSLRRYEDFEEHTHLVAGAWPAAPVAGRRRLAVVIGQELARDYGLEVGDTLGLSAQRQDITPDVTLEVAGIAAARAPDDAYWFGAYGPLEPQKGRRDARYNVFVPPDRFYEAITATLPNAKLAVSWNVSIARAQLTPRSAQALIAAIATLRTQLNDAHQIVMDTALPQTLERFEDQATVVRAPLYLLTAEIVLLALYYVVMTAALAVHRAEPEFALLGGRGASRSQVFVMQAIEAGVLILVALASGPLLGQALVRLLTALGPLADLDGGAWWPERSLAAWLAAGIAALASILGLLLPVLPALRRSVVAQQRGQARATRRPWWQRTYLDVFAVAAGLILLWRLHLYGGIVGGVANSPEVDWLLLLSPIALLVGSAAILLRIFPLVLSLLERVVALGRGLLGPLALWPSARQPAHVARLVLLLTLAMALGILATGLNATLDLSERERATYAVGSDVRMALDDPAAVSALATTPGVRAVTALWRGVGSTQLLDAYPRFEILAIAPDAVTQLATFRSDFAAEPMPALLSALAPDPAATGPGTASAGPTGAFKEGPLPIDGHPGSLSLWLWAPPDAQAGLPSVNRARVAGSSNHERVEITAKLRANDGMYLLLPMKPARSEDCTATCWGDLPCSERFPWAGISNYTCAWVYYQTTVPDLSDDAYPLSLMSLWFRNRTYLTYRNSLQLLRQVEINLAIDDIATTDRTTGMRTSIEDFEGPTTLWIMDAGSSHYTTFGGHTAPARQDLSLTFTQGRQRISFSPYTTAQAGAVPALVSPAFAEATQLADGETFQAWPTSLPAVSFRIAGRVTYFPTMFENQPVDGATQPGTTPDAGFVVVDRDALLLRMNYLSYKAVNANEVWLATGAPTSEPLTLDRPGTRDTVTQEQVRRTLKAQPIALGLRSVTFAGYVLTSLLSLVGFGTYFVMTARERATQYGVLRSLGLSAPQLYLSLAIEQIVLVFWGLSLGTGLGILLNRLVLPGLPVSLGDSPPVPPFIPQDDWLAVGRLYVLLAGAFLAVIGLATMLLWRTRLHRALRIGQE